MNKELSIVLVLIIALESCGQNTDSISQYLDGKWEWVGFYKNDHPLYDTLYTAIDHKFQPEQSDLKYIFIWTDSGTYVHHYKNHELIGIELSSKSRISEFNLSDKQSGKVFDYEIDSSKYDGEDPSFKASAQNFIIEGKTIIFHDSNISTKVIVEKITEDELILKFEDGKTSRFIKYNNEP